MTPTIDNTHDLTVGIILGMGSASERRRYYVTPFFIGPAPTQHDPCTVAYFHPGVLDVMVQTNLFGDTVAENQSKNLSRVGILHYLSEFRDQIKVLWNFWGSLPNITHFISILFVSLIPRPFPLWDPFFRIFMMIREHLFRYHLTRYWLRSLVLYCITVSLWWHHWLYLMYYVLWSLKFLVVFIYVVFTLWL